MKHMKKRHRWIAAFGPFCALMALVALAPERFPGGVVLMQKLRGKATVGDRLAEFGPVARSRWQPHFTKKNVAYPPQKILLLGLKRKKTLQVYAAGAGQELQLIRTLPVLGQSGKMGPKLRFGDLQVPEGFYRIESLNPNSAFHLALRVNYPNEFDRAQAAKEGRAELGGDIMIHGSNASIGCLAMGDEAAEDLFVLAAETGLQNIEVILSPLDFRTSDVPDDNARPAWVQELYARIESQLKKLPRQ
ncbi:MAG TPA: L,D-transpeptidase family protein [Abditibacteriaceae bacterium]|jgi:hypothetical protein